MYKENKQSCRNRALPSDEKDLDVEMKSDGDYTDRLECIKKSETLLDKGSDRGGTEGSEM